MIRRMMVLVGLTGMLAVAACATPVCTMTGPLNVCVDIQPSAVQIGVQNFETQNDYLPVTGYWLEGRLLLSDGTFQAFKLRLDRENWAALNSVLINTAVPPQGVDKLSIIQLRSETAARIY